MSMTYEDVAKSAQRHLAERPVVVLGTGATIPCGLPSMPALAAHLLATIQDDSSQWEEFSARLEETKDLERSLHAVALPEEAVERIVMETWKLVAQHDIEFYHRVLKRADPFPLADLFKYLLRTADAHIHVVTPNYDRVAEYAANEVGAYVSTGVTAGWIQRFVPTATLEEKPPAPGYDGHVSLLKVHGSLDWFQNEANEIVGIPMSLDVPGDLRPLVVTPGVSKYREVHKDPFRTVMSAADAVLRAASCYLCVGYGFNDEHIEPILVSRVSRDDIPIVVVTKELSPRARAVLLSSPPKHFLLLEESKDDAGTMVYDPQHPEGVSIADISFWQLDVFMKMIEGEQVN